MATTAMVVLQVAAFSLLWLVWKRDGKPRPFRRWLLVLAFSEEAARMSMPTEEGAESDSKRYSEVG